MGKRIKRRMSYVDFLREKSKRKRKHSKKKDIVNSPTGPTGIDGRAQHGRITDWRTGAVGHYALVDDVADVEMALQANEEMEKERERLWSVRALFANGKDEQGRFCKRKQVGVFVLRPTGKTKEEGEELLVLPRGDWDAKRSELRENYQSLAGIPPEMFTVEDRSPVSQPVISRESLLNLLVKKWRRHPVNTLGEVQLVWPSGHITIYVNREALLSTHGRDELFGHVGRILDLMDSGFQYDPTIRVEKGSVAGALRRMGIKDFDVWRNRGQ